MATSNRCGLPLHRFVPLGAIGIDRFGSQSQRAVPRKSAAGHYRNAPNAGDKIWAQSIANCKRGLAAIKFPPGYRWELAGSYKAQQESFGSLLMVLLVASALVFLLLGFSIPQPDVAAVDFFDAAGFAGERHVCALDYSARR